MVIRCEINSCSQLWLPSHPRSCRSLDTHSRGQEPGMSAGPMTTSPGHGHQQANCVGQKKDIKPWTFPPQGQRAQLASCQSVTVTRNQAKPGPQPHWRAVFLPRSHRETQIVTGDRTARSLLFYSKAEHCHLTAQHPGIPGNTPCLSFLICNRGHSE